MKKGTVIVGNDERIGIVFSSYCGGKDCSKLFMEISQLNPPVTILLLSKQNIRVTIGELLKAVRQGRTCVKVLCGDAFEFWEL